MPYDGGWHPTTPKAPPADAVLTGEALKTHQENRKTVAGVKFVKVSVDSGLEPGEEVTYYCGSVGKALYKFWLLVVYLAKHGVIPQIGRAHV